MTAKQTADEAIVERAANVEIRIANLLDIAQMVAGTNDEDGTDEESSFPPGVQALAAVLSRELSGMWDDAAAVTSALRKGR